MDGGLFSIYEPEIDKRMLGNQIYSSTLVAEIDEYLYEIDSPTLISRFVSKSPLIISIGAI